MFGAIIGDIVGSRFEHDNYRAKDFDFWHAGCKFTDDSVCTAAVADILLHAKPPAATLQEWCRAYPGRGYGGFFGGWIQSQTPEPYGSFGNGAAMRVAPAAFLFRDDLTAALAAADAVTAITHNHAEGIKGARATTHAIFLALQGGGDHGSIRKVIAEQYGYDLQPSVDQIRETYTYNETCQATVPQAVTCALESGSFEDAIRNAVSIGGDSDTVAAIAGGVAEAMHGIPQELLTAARAHVDARIAGTLDALYARVTS